MASGKIAYAVLSVGGLLGMGDKLFAVPWPALTLAAVNKCFTLNVPKETLKDAPGFNQDRWPAMSDKGSAHRDRPHTPRPARHRGSNRRGRQRPGMAAGQPGR